jgi:glycerol kinase
MTRYILALDQGTTSSRAILFDREGSLRGVGQHEFTQIYPRPGWVEHDPEEIWRSQMSAIKDALAAAGASITDVDAIGITNQRETVVVWDRKTGIPVYNAIVWQCRRTADLCGELVARGYDDLVRSKTGLVIDAYFSGTKVAWILENVPEARQAASEGRLVFGTIDSWLIAKLTGFKEHITDPSNASRTMLFDIHKVAFDTELLAMLDIPMAMCPEIVDSSGVVAMCDPAILGHAVPIAGIAGDQQSALFGQACYLPGSVKNTYGTGSFMLMNTGPHPVASSSGLVTTIAWQKGGTTTYALEGSIFITGAVVQWLRDELGLIRTSEETEELALSVPDSGGVYLVPAFVGLGAPWWDGYARGTVIGLTRGTNKAHFVRAALESIAYQSFDVLTAMLSDSSQDVQALKVDGGAINNAFLAQFQADIAQIPVERPAVTETTAMGAAFLAGLATGFWQDEAELETIWAKDATFLPSIDADQRDRLVRGWHRAVERARNWAKEEA